MPTRLAIALATLLAATTARAGEPLMLAFSWQPAFCETSPGLTECRRAGPADPTATRFSLHGLWPQPRSQEYCDTAPGLEAMDRRGDWLSLPLLPLWPDTRARLTEVMPGVASGLHRHEWLKHGTCYRDPRPEAYYRDSLWLMDRINASGLRALMALRRGREVTADEIRGALDASFGAGVGDRTRILCFQVGGRRMIGELRMSLEGPVGTGADLGDRVRAAPPDDDLGCESGEVDRVGIQGGSPLARDAP